MGIILDNSREERLAMLEIKVASEMDIPMIQELLQENKIDLNSLNQVFPNSMIAYEGRESVAAAGFSDCGEEAVIQYVVVKKERHGEYLGDGIIKALLNFADKKGIKWVYVKGTEVDHFFNRVGFKEIPYSSFLEIGSPFVTNQFNKKDIIFSTTLPDFFLRACRSNKS